MKTNVYDMTGKQVGEIELSEAVFGIEPNVPKYCLFSITSRVIKQFKHCGVPLSLSGAGAGKMVHQ